MLGGMQSICLSLKAQHSLAPALYIYTYKFISNSMQTENANRFTQTICSTQWIIHKNMKLTRWQQKPKLLLMAPTFSKSHWKDEGNTPPSGWWRLELSPLFCRAFWDLEVDNFVQTPALAAGYLLYTVNLLCLESWEVWKQHKHSFFKIKCNEYGKLKLNGTYWSSEPLLLKMLGYKTVY